MILFDNVGKAFRSRKDKRELIWPVRNFTTEVRQGESTGILVPEGGGKTTLIDLVSGSEIPTEGEIVRKGGMSWPVSYRGAMSGKMTGKQNLRFLADCYGRNYSAAYDFLVEFSELGRYVDMPLKTYSNEQRNRLAISMLFAMDFKLIIVDDVFESGDGRFRRKLASYIEENKSNITFFMATGSVRLIEQYCQRAGVLKDGTVTFYDTKQEAIAVFQELEESLLD